VLVDKLRMTIPPEQETKIIEPGNDPLQLDAIHQKDCQRRLGFTYVIKEGVL